MKNHIKKEQLKLKNLKWDIWRSLNYMKHYAHPRVYQHIGESMNIINVAYYLKHEYVRGFYKMLLLASNKLYFWLIMKSLWYTRRSQVINLFLKTVILSPSLGKLPPPHKKSSPLNGGAIKAYPPPPLERWNVAKIFFGFPYWPTFLSIRARASETDLDL